MKRKVFYGMITLALVLSLMTPGCTRKEATPDTTADTTSTTPTSTSIPNVLINELLPDPFGMDKDPTGPRNGGQEALELVNLDNGDADVSNWIIKNAQGNALITLPAGTTIPGKDTSKNQYYYLVVILGSKIPSLVDDFNDADTPYSKTVFLGSDKGDLIDNNSDAVVIENTKGEVLDAVLFGVQEPTGPEVDKVKNGNQWIGVRVNTSFAQGGIPLGDGEEILGRNRDSKDSNSASDWRLDGGANALGGTFGGENRPNRFFPDSRVLLHDIQGYVNEMVAYISMSNSVPTSSYLGINNAYYNNVVVTSTNDDYIVTANHHFTYTKSGLTTGTLSGNLTATYKPTAGQSDILEVNGSLTDTINGNSLTISIKENLFGFGTKSHSSSLDIAITWTEVSGSYSYHNIATWVETWVAQDRKTITDHRQYTDWSSPIVKVSDAKYDIQYTSDGVTATDFNLQRPRPYWAEPFGQIQMPSTTTELVHYQFTTTINSDREVTRKFTLYDIFVDDGTSKTKYMELTPNAQGSLLLTRTSGVTGDFIGIYDETLDLPLIVYHMGTLPEPKHLTKNKTLTQEFITNPAGDEVFVARAKIVILINGVQAQRFDYYVDGWKWWVSKIAKVVAVGTCAAGAAVTSPSVVGAVGFTAGSAVVYELWDVVESQDDKSKKD